MCVCVSNSRPEHVEYVPGWHRLQDCELKTPVTKEFQHQTHCLGQTSDKVLDYCERNGIQFWFKRSGQSRLSQRFPFLWHWFLPVAVEKDPATHNKHTASDNSEAPATRHPDIQAPTCVVCVCMVVVWRIPSSLTSTAVWSRRARRPTAFQRSCQEQRDWRVCSFLETVNIEL
jgi:hypothetical protein